MVFASQKLRQRGENETVFHIRGLVRTRQDIERYWRRRSVSPGQFSPIAQTPPGIRYGTPRPFPECDIALNESQEDTAIAKDADVELVWTPRSLFAESSKDPGAYLFDVRDTVLSTYQSATLHLVKSPEPFRRQEHVFRCAEAYFSSISERSKGSLDSTALDVVKKANLRLLRTSRRVAEARNHSPFPLDLQLAKMDLFSSIPDVVRADKSSHPILTIGWLGALACLQNPTAGRQMPELIARVSKEMVYQAAKEHSSKSPLTQLLQALDASLDPAFPNYERVLLVGRDVMIRDLSEEHISTMIIRFELAVICRKYGDPTASLAHLTQIQQVHSRRLWTTAARADLIDYLPMQCLMASCYMDLRNYQAAHDLTENGLERCPGIAGWFTRNTLNAHFLFLRGRLRIDTGDVDGAILYFTQALEIGLAMMQVEAIDALDPLMVSTASALHKLERDRDELRARTRIYDAEEEMES